MQVAESARGKVHVIARKKHTACGSRLFHGGQTYFWPDAVKITCRKCMNWLAATAGECKKCGAKQGSFCRSSGGKRARRHSGRTD